MSEIDPFFDQFLAAGTAPWLIRRRDEAIGPVESNSGLPPDVPDAPQLHAAGFPMKGVFFSLGGEFYVPDYALSGPGDDPHFAFAVTQNGEVDEADGGPFNRATLTVSVRSFKGPRLEQIAWEKPLRLVPNLAVTPIITVPMTAQDGSTQIKSVPGSAQDDGNGNTVLTFELKGSVVEAAYVHLTRLTVSDAVTIGLEIGATFAAYQLAEIRCEATGLNFTLWGNGTDSPFVPIDPGPEGQFWIFPVTARFNRPLSIGSVFHTDVFRRRFTVSTGGVTRPIIDVDDLARFAGPRSEYRELTSLGNVQGRYPSVRALYFGQVSGTVVAVPTLYGIESGSTGLAVACDSVVDPSPGSSTRCRFHFTFTLAPVIDPVDLAGLARDITTIAEADGRTLRLRLPSGLDRRFTSTLDGFTSGVTGFADGTAAGTLVISLDIVDDGSIPSTSLVNMLLVQLASRPPAPLFGNLSVRLDDVYPTAVRTQMVLNVRQSAGTDELTITVDAAGPNATVDNIGPFDVILHRYAAINQSGLEISSLADTSLASGQSTTLQIDADTTAVALARSLAVPPIVPSAQLLKYVRFNTTVVSELQHPLNVNATAIDFAGSAITTIGIVFTLTQSPALPIPKLTLSPSHPIDFVHVQIPVGTAVTGLDCTVTLTITTTTDQLITTLRHDFTTEPILTLTTDAITP